MTEKPACDILAPSVPMALPPGTVLGGRYLLGEMLGEGGLSIVHAAFDRRLERNVAIKLLRGDRASAELLRRFVTEARTLARIQSRHVVGVLDLGVFTNEDRERVPYMVLELLEGSDLRAFSRELGTLPPSWVALAALQACEALAAAHAVGIVHRDVKPENIFVVGDGVNASLEIKVVDFGIAKTPRPQQRQPRVTLEGEQLGSPGYMAPEQLCDARDVDERTDIWSLGVVMYELLAGGPPFCGGTQREICASILTGNYLPLDAINPSLPEGYVTIVHRCIQADRQLRFDDVLGLARALAPYAGPEGRAHVAEIERGLTPAGDVHAAKPSERPDLAPYAETAHAPPPNEEDVVVPLTTRRRSLRRWTARALCLAALLPLTALAALAVGSRLEPTAAPSRHAVRALRGMADDLAGRVGRSLSRGAAPN